MGLDYATARVRYFIKLARDQCSWYAKCEVCHERAASEIHHMKGRTGELLTDPTYFLGVCRSCHNKITLNPEWAHDLGYSATRHSPERGSETGLHPNP